MEILAPAAKVPSIRSSAIRLPPLSTTAITPVVFLLFASATAPAIARFAPSSVRDFTSVTCAGLKDTTPRRAVTVMLDLKIFMLVSIHPLEPLPSRFIPRSPGFEDVVTDFPRMKHASHQQSRNDASNTQKAFLVGESHSPERQ